MTTVAEIQAGGWQAHTCAGCGSVYSYHWPQTPTGLSSNDIVATGQRFLALLIPDNQMQPCPRCGLYQNEMIGQRLARNRLLLFIASVVCLVSMLAGASDDHLPPLVVSWMMGFICAGLCIGQFLLELKHPNKDLAANLAMAQARVAEGKLRHLPATAMPAAYARQVAELARPAKSLVHRLAFLLVLLSLVAEISPEVIRVARRWPVNDDCYPPVAGPGDETKFYMTKEIDSVDGLYRGGPLITLVCPGSPLNQTHVDATSSKDIWGTSIFNANSTDSTTHPWVSIKLPDDPSLAGQRITLSIDLGVTFPVHTSDASFEDKSDEIKESVQINLAPRGAGRQYNTIFWAGTIGGVPFALLGGFLLYRQARALAEKAD